MIYQNKNTQYKIEFNPSSNTWCLYRYNLTREQINIKPIYQSIDKKDVKKELKEILKKKGRKETNERI